MLPALIVLGMHRSGTSALAGSLHLLGADAGRHLSVAQENINPRGFWEHVGIEAAHERLLTKLGSGWYDERPLPERWMESHEANKAKQALVSILREEFASSSLWLVKDPRMCRLLPLWKALLAELGVKPIYVLIVRNPSEVAASLARRDDFVEDKSRLLWLSHVLESERETRDQPRLIVSYEALLSNWKRSLAPLIEVHGLPLALNDPTAVKNVDNFLEPALRHHSGSSRTKSGSILANIAFSVYEAMLTGAIDDLDELYVKTSTAIESHAPWLAQVNGLVSKLRSCELLRMEQSASLEALNAESKALNAEIVRVKGTVSWRVTAPLRAAWNIGQKLISKSREKHTVSR